MTETEQRSRRTWTEEDLRSAEQHLATAVYNKKDVIPLRIPSRPIDFAALVCDCVNELLEYRAKQRACESTKAMLKRLLRYYDGRVRVVQRLMNQSTDVEVAARHAAGALEWDVRKQTVLTVARNLEIELETATDPVADDTKGGCVSQDSIAVCSSDGPDKELVFGAGLVSPQPPTPPTSVPLFLDERKLTPNVESRIRARKDPLAGAPESIKTWLREIDWPYDQPPQLSFEQGSFQVHFVAAPPWHWWRRPWIPDRPITVSVHDMQKDVHLSARFLDEQDGTWTRVPFPGEAQP